MQREMKIILLTLLVLCGIGLHVPTAAGEKIYQYCLESGDSGGGSTVNCAYATREQCVASKSGPADTCYPNPQSGRR